jgi:hypothetical protein
MIMQCPICDGLADDLPNTIDGKSIHCERCGDFDVTGSVYDTGLLQPLDPEERREALENAKRSAPQGKRPIITTHSLRKVMFSGSTEQDANRKADDWCVQHRDVRITRRASTDIGFRGPSLREVGPWTVTIEYEADV